jgi:uncharacterized protein YrrD
MKTLVTALLLAGVATRSILPAAADTAGTNSPSGMVTDARNRVVSHEFRLCKLTEMNGADVRNPEKEKLGDVKDAVVDLSRSRILFVIVSVGGFLGIGDKWVALPPGSLTWTEDQKTLLLNADKASLRAAPGFQKNRWPDLSDAGYGRKVYASHGQEKAWNMMTPRGEEVVVRSGDRIDEAAGALREHEGARPKNNQGSVSENPRVTSGVSRLNAARAGNLLGLMVKSAEDENLGEIKDLVLELSSGEIIYAVVGSGGVLGLGDRAVPVPPSLLIPKENFLVLNVAKERFQKAPGLDRNHWPLNAEDPTILEAYRYYGAPPLWSRRPTQAPEIRESAGAELPELPPPPEASATRARGDLPTASDQRSNDGDFDVARKIRKAVTATPHLSIRAKNIKIICAGGRVTLRGSVKNPEEKKIVETIARNQEGVVELDSELFVRRAE